MSMSVCKFGGSSLADAAMFVRVNRILQDDPNRSYIVLSAPGKRFPDDEKITDLFYRAHEEAALGDHSILGKIFLRYASIRDALAPEFDLEAEFARFYTDLPLSPDYAASRGEYLCAKLFAAYAHLPFIDAKDLLFFDAEGAVDLEKSRAAIRERLSGLPHAIIPGFYGSDAGGRIRTFSRGGSDVSGALICACIGATLYENWTDVDGLYTADPRIVDRPMRNRLVRIDQMERIARAGAQLLHPDALRWLKGTGADTLLKDTLHPGAAGTRIHEGDLPDVRCVTGKRRMYMIGDASAQGGRRQPVLHSLPLHGAMPVAVVRAFGLSDSALARAAQLLKPIHIIHMQDYIEIITAESEYETAVRCVHELLMLE